MHKTYRIAECRDYMMFIEYTSKSYNMILYNANNSTIDNYITLMENLTFSDISAIYSIILNAIPEVSHRNVNVNETQSVMGMILYNEKKRVKTTIYPTSQNSIEIQWDNSQSLRNSIKIKIEYDREFSFSGLKELITDYTIQTNRLCQQHSN